MIVNGNDIKKRILESIKQRAKISSILAAVIIGSEKNALRFIEAKKRAAQEAGITFKIIKKPSSISESTLQKLVYGLGENKKIGGIILQLPLPKKINTEKIIKIIPEHKDPDCLLGVYFPNHQSRVMSPAVAAVKEVLRKARKTLQDKNIVIIGQGQVTGKPIALWRELRKTKEVAVSMKGDKKRKEHLKKADIIISGTGEAGIISVKELKKGALVVDFGYSKKGKDIKGDFNPRGAEEKEIDYTPTPGGTGPIVVAKVLENFYKLNKKDKKA
ncbi:MAG: hypothetical protein COU08_00860 [Candidatus Harrisonbacteria bacterium CG10_big_fil_rev_8_21_14_0_10_42_17]|uniref:Methenyltetrahydrofolate cyclohydrolase n=1 Tax=Candidatus Harrisonbacteria bacterium CG10_big_fil_rev_8_21_14_0_10_42_17 TaxID=1974584 RepID=A0A2M6WIS2_9BACT|nr:MAG: hypothetical protein COU08_00860 [Candidatus Harrisonbacteria bacterium CG10_big_fil_rev_8_21_14_0_10_42_17]